MTCLFRLRSVECQVSNEAEDELSLRVGGAEIWKGQMVQGASIRFTDEKPVAEFNDQVHVTLWELDAGGIFGSESDLIGDVVVSKPNTSQREQITRLPQEGSEYNGIYFISYDLVPLD